jgi:hypothetical protein
MPPSERDVEPPSPRPAARPDIRVEVGGFGATTGGEDDAALPPGAPVIHLRGYAYKGTIEVRTRPRER